MQKSKIRLPVVDRLNGIPIVEVMLNGQLPFRMVVDTGASSSLIPAYVAARLSLTVCGRRKIETVTGCAYSDVVEVEISIPGLSVVVHADANEQMDVGLLGHDFWGDRPIYFAKDYIAIEEETDEQMAQQTQIDPDLLKIAVQYESGSKEERSKIDAAVSQAIEQEQLSKSEWEAACKEARRMIAEAKGKGQGQQQQQQPKQEKPQQQQQKEGKGGGDKGDRSSSTSDADDDHKEMMRLVWFFWGLRALVMLVNVRLYMVMADALLLAGAAAEAQGYIKSIPFLGWIVLFAIGWLMWFGFQMLETYKGEGTWAIRGGAYVVDTTMSVITFPPLLVDWQLFLRAPMLSDINQGNAVLCAITVGAWELLNFVEQKVFTSKYGKKAKFGFWGVKVKSLK